MVQNPIKTKRGRPSKADIMERERLKSTYPNENQFGTDGSADSNQRSSVTVLNIRFQLRLVPLHHRLQMQA